MGEWLGGIVDFLNQGGLPLWLVAAAAFVLWTLALSQYGYILREFKADRAAMIERWRRFEPEDRGHPEALRRLLLSQARGRFAGPLTLLRTVVAVAPLLGLLGTVMGMIEVFEVLAAVGTGDARAMATGVARATLPTMAGMMLAILGLFFISQFEGFQNRQIRALEDALEVK